MKWFAHNRQTDRCDGLNENEMGLSSFEMLEPRVLLSATLIDGLDDLNVAKNADATAIRLWNYFDEDVSRTIIDFQTVLGDFQVELYDDTTPFTVDNFLNYVSYNDWDGSFVHRSIPGFVVQGGGYRWDFDENWWDPVISDDPVVNEPVHSNVRGTIAMAKIGGDPNSATNQWFFNLADNNDPDNPNSLDNQNGGFTAFGEVLGNGMDIVDAIAALDRVNAGSPFDNLPVVNWDQQSNITGDNLVIFDAVDLVEELEYTVVTNSNDGLVSATIENGRLELSFVENQTGSAVIEIQARSLVDDSIVTDTFTVSVGVPQIAAGILPQYLEPGGDTTVALPIHFFDAEQASDTLTYSVDGNSNDAVITAAVDGTNLLLSAADGSAGISVVTIRATDTDGLSVTYDVTVTSGLQVVLGDDGDPDTTNMKSLQFIDSDGTPVTVSYSGPGTAAVFVDGLNHNGTPKGSTIQLDGDDIDILQIVVTDSTDKSSLSIKTGKGGDNVTTVENIDVTGTLKSFDAKTTDLIGNITVSESLLALSLHDIDAAHTITIGSRGNTRDTLTFSAASVIDTALISAIPIKSITVTQWLDQDGLDNDLIQASSLGSLTTKGDSRANPAIAGDFQADLELNDTAARAALGSVKIAGNATGLWQVIGAAGSISAGSFDSDWTGFFASDYDSFFGDTELDIFDDGWTGTAYEVKSIKATGDFDGEVYAATIGSVSAGGDSADAALATNSDVGESGIKSISIKGAATDMYLLTRGTVGSISLGSATNFIAYLMDVGSFKVSGDITGNMVVGAADQAGSLKSLSATGSVSGGGLYFYGDIGSISVGGDMGNVLSLGAAENPGTLKSVNVKGNIASGDWALFGEIGSISAGIDLETRIIIGDNDTRSSLKSLDVKGNYEASLVRVYGHADKVSVGQDFIGNLSVGRASLKGNLKSLNIKGSVEGGIEVIGDVGSASISGDYTGTFKVGADGDTVDDVSGHGTLKSLNIKGDVSDADIIVRGTAGSIAAASFDTVTTEFDDIKAINVKGNITDSVILADGDVQTISANAMIGTNVRTGDIKTLSTKGDFSGWIYAADIGSLNVKGNFTGNDEIGDADADAGWAGFTGLDDHFVTKTSILVDYIKSLSIGGNYAGNLAFYGVDGAAVGAINIKGVVTSTVWELGIDGQRADVGAISVGSLDGTLLIADDMKSLKSNDDVVGFINGNSLGSLSVKDQMAANLTLTGLGDIRSTLGSAKITGEIDGADWILDGTVGAISAGSFDAWQLTGSADVKSISAKTALDAVINANTVGSVSSGTTMTGSINLAGQNNPRTTIKSVTAKGDIDDLFVDVTGEMGSLTGNNINGLTMNFDNASAVTAKGNLANSNLDGDALKSLSVKGNMTDTNLDLDQAVADRVTALGSAKIGGDVTGGEWDIEGHVGAVSANSFGENLADDDWTADILGDLKSITTKGDLAGELTANAIASISVKGDLVDSTITLSESAADPKVMALGKMSVTGSIDNTAIDSAGNVGTVTAKSMINESSLKVGVSDDAEDFPVEEEGGEIADDYSIKSLTLKGARDEFAFSDSVIVVSTLSKVSMGNVDVDNSDVQFGIAVETLGTLSLLVDGERLSLKNPLTQGVVDAAIADAGINLDDAKIRLVYDPLAMSSAPWWAGDILM